MNATTALFLLAAATLPVAGTRLPAAQDPQAPGAEVQDDELDRLRRDQEEILRKGGRLRDLMVRMKARYEREGKTESVALLTQGLEHLERSGVMQEVAGIRDDIAAAAFAQAQRKQKDVIADLERLLNILLERKSIENLKKDIEQTTAMAATARELERRQAELQQRTAEATQREPTAAERELLERLDQLRREQQNEAQRNARDAGMRQPFLEDALQRIDALLQQQERLERAVADEASGKTQAARQQQFDVGEMIQRTKALMGQVRDQGTQEKLQAEAQAMRDAAATGDQSALQQARDRLQASLENAPKVHDDPEGPRADREWQELRQKLQNAEAGATPQEREKLTELANQASEMGQRKSQEARKRNAAQAGKLQQQAEASQQQLAGGEPPKEGSPAESMQKASSELQNAAGSAPAGEPKQTQEQLEKALRALEEAKARLQQQNPDAGRQADQMAADADAAARELQNAPQAQEAEQQAAKALENAEQQLRDASQKIDDARNAGQPPSPQPQMQASRQNLQQAKETLQQALQQNNAERGGDQQQASQRQQQLRAQAEQAKQQMQQARQQGSLSEAQAKGAEQKMQQAVDKMQQAEQRLQQGQQSSAAQAQQQAAESLQQAQQELQRNQEPTPAQKDALQKLAEEQKKLQDDIVKLAQEAKERQNQKAQQALEDAAEAARKAQQAMQQGDMEETEQQQEQARQKLEEASEELEEERDRYMDQRQEELLFRMRDELTQFLDKQRPLTQQTLEIQKAAGTGTPSRPQRNKLKQFGEEEQELAGRIQGLIQALVEEGNMVYRAVLEANHEDLKEVARRLNARSPDAGSYTTMLQQDVETRTENLLAALERERKRREEDRQRQQQQQQQQQQKGQNKFNQQRERLVSLIAELEMLKQLELDTRDATQDLGKLVELRGDDTITEAEVAMIERLANRHGEVTRLFQQIKAGVEETMQQMQQQEGEDPQGGEGRGR
ncbi:MAG: hypothetical protein IPK26_13965 [Planctomycetes bacterium]|nr:hypothetical protein [Planctomycetota bacterium]